MVLVPIGSQVISQTQLQLERDCLCEQCRNGFTYRYKLIGTGADTSFLWLNNEAAGIGAEAQANSEVRSQANLAFPPFPCPHCGHFQSGMIRYFKRELLQNLYIFSIISLAMFIIISFIFAINDSFIDMLTSNTFWKLGAFPMSLFLGVTCIRMLARPTRMGPTTFQVPEIQGRIPTSPGLRAVREAALPADSEWDIPEFYASRRHGRVALFTSILFPVSIIFSVLAFMAYRKCLLAFRSRPDACPVPDRSGLTYAIISLCIIFAFSGLAAGAFLS